MSRLASQMHRVLHSSSRKRQITDTPGYQAEYKFASRPYQRAALKIVDFIC
jgi:hypothetical protein